MAKAAPAFAHPHLLGIDGLSRDDIEAVLQRADHHAQQNAARERTERTLGDRTLINLFFEPSTRTQASFELAAKRLGATVMNMSVKQSSMTKGETLVDTATTLNAMLPDILVVRHSASGAVGLLADKVNCAVVNAGDGWREHPTQALLDALTMRRVFRLKRGEDSPAAKLEGLRIAICGDIAHSRVARSNILLQRLLGNEVRVAGPTSLVPQGIEAMGATVCSSLKEAIEGADVVMMLRLQNERMAGSYIASLREYYHRYGLNESVLQAAAPDALVMHPGPMNRGVEIDSELADDSIRSVIATQVEMGVAVRMAVLELVAGNLPHTARKSDRAAEARPRGVFYGKNKPAEPQADRPIAFLGARLVDPESGRETTGDCIVLNGVIAQLGQNLLAAGPAEDVVRIECQGAALAPGLVDLEVFIGEPGSRHRESFGSGGEAAVAGGVTTIVTQPDTNPPVDDPSLLEFIAKRVEEERGGHAMPHVRTMAALTKGLEGREMAEYDFLLAAGAVGLSEGDRTIADTMVLRRCFQAAAALGALVSHRTLDPFLSKGACATESAVATRLGLPAAPAEAEAMALRRDLSIVELTGVRYHAAQVSTASSVTALRRAKERGLDVTAAVSASHLLLSEDDIADFRTYLKLDPPLRSDADRRAVLKAVSDGVIDCIVSAHTPQSEESKRQPFSEAAPGAVGLETLLSAALEAGKATGMSLAAVFRSVSLNPARRLGIDCGRLALGATADLVLFDPGAAWEVNRRELQSKSKNSPFDRRQMQGVVRRTMVAGRTVYVANQVEEA